MSINWRASLVPAAAVIPAPIAYIKVVAVKKLVVGFLLLSTVFTLRVFALKLANDCDCIDLTVSVFQSCYFE
jgi:hypothetical protein